MASLKDQLGGLVYSTETGNLCPRCQSAVNACCCTELDEQERLSKLDGIVRISRETKGRKGKGVTLITGIPLGDKALKAFAKTLKKQCGTGGALKDSVIEIQGDHRETLKVYLEKQNYKVKLAGG